MLKRYLVYLLLLGLFICVKNKIIIVMRLEKMKLFELMGKMFCNIFNKN